MTLRFLSMMVARFLCLSTSEYRVLVVLVGSWLNC